MEVTVGRRRIPDNGDAQSLTLKDVFTAVFSVYGKHEQQSDHVVTNFRSKDGAMAKKPNYGFQKHQKEIKRQKKQEEKRQRRQQNKENVGPTTNPPAAS